ncbi:MAG: bifunctional rRNA ((2069)-N(7))-methyltransferase RlmK/23S rRNA [Pseudomonadota bacterium]|jgi:23S rRNA (guanine2445-N2)-methyltransferase / 23S rRNA (guanine2069-N7)-methyltransferase
MNYFLFATTPKAMEMILAAELREFGGQNIQPTIAGVSFEADLLTAYRICLWSRTANRVLLSLADFTVLSAEQLYDEIQRIDWNDHFSVNDSFAVTFNVKNSPVIDHSHYGALKVKDAIVDQFRQRYGQRPNVNTEKPSVWINVHLNRYQASLSLDLSGDSLHKRGFRSHSVDAPMKENLAAALLLRSGWQAIAEQQGSLIDPMCGSGTLLIEAAMIAADYAPGLHREYYGFLGWKQHDAQLWHSLLTEAEQRKQKGLQKMPTIVGFDQQRSSVNAALQNLQATDLQKFIHIERRNITELQPASSWTKGLVICNPPYGQRLGTETEVAELYQHIGQVLRTQFYGWQAAVIILDAELGFRFGIRSHKPITFFNGALECKLLRLQIEESEFFIPKSHTVQQRLSQTQTSNDLIADDIHISMFVNRLHKNLKMRRKWAQQQKIYAYRVYDADLPEYAVAIDVYYGEQCWVNVQEYEPPKTIDPKKAMQRLTAILAQIPIIFAIPKSQVFLKVRAKQKSQDQYQKFNQSEQFYSVIEGDCQFWVHFDNYIDTGLFLDHRPLRLLFAKQANGKRFLNLFAYTATASVHAAKAGAKSTLSVDLSNTYLTWAKRNFELNRIHGDHQFIQADVLSWLAQQAEKKYPLQFDLILLDPPTFSNSKRMNNVLDIQKDYVDLIRQTMRLLTPKGILYFSTHFRQFKLDLAALSEFTIENITPQTIPFDFARDHKIHYCWKITHESTI